MICTKLTDALEIRGGRAEDAAKAPFTNLRQRVHSLLLQGAQFDDDPVPDFDCVQAK